jgi:formylglycine-generating enzyme required for sulfatase activity
MADIFISYASEDRERIVPIVKALAAEGWSAFWDWKSIPVGRTWREIIDQGLETSKCILVLWSITSTTSKKRWVLEEADYGLEHAKLIPALIDDVRPPRGFGQIQAARLTDWTGDIDHPEFRKLIAALETILGPSPRRLREPGDGIRAQAEREGEPPRRASAGPASSEADRVPAATAVPKPPAPRKYPAVKIGALVALAALIAAGLLLLRPGKQEPIRAAPVAGKTAFDAARGASPGDRMPAAADEPDPKSTPKKITNSLGMEFLLIPAGSFTMGSRQSSKQALDRLGGKEEWYKFEHPPQDVTLSHSFYLQATEVTQRQWKEVMGDNPSYFKQCGEDCPVESVSWEDAHVFIARLNQLEGTDAYRLPSEAEWEYAARAGTATDYSFGDDAGRLGVYAWFAGNSSNTTQPVAGKKPNPRGLYDMHGNVAEWVEDDWNVSRKGAPADGRVWVDNPRGSDRVVRGGDWGSEAQRSRSASRSGFWPDCRNDGIGIRLAKSVSPGT